MEVNGYQHLFGYQQTGTTCGWVHYESFFIFEWTMPLKKHFNDWLKILRKCHVCMPNSLWLRLFHVSRKVLVVKGCQCQWILFMVKFVCSCWKSTPSRINVHSWSPESLSVLPMFGGYSKTLHWHSKDRAWLRPWGSFHDLFSLFHCVRLSGNKYGKVWRNSRKCGQVETLLCMKAFSGWVSQ